jgi:hypothetical protein
LRYGWDVLSVGAAYNILRASAGGWVNECASYLIAGDHGRRFSFCSIPSNYSANTRDAFWTVIAIACGVSLNLIYLWFSKPGGPPVAIEDKPPVAVEEKAPVVDKPPVVVREKAPMVDRPPVVVEEKAPVVDKPPVVVEGKAPVVDKANDAQADKSSGKRGSTPGCEKEIRRTADLLRFFANRIQQGEEIQSVVADMRQQEKRIAAVCPD